MAPHPCWPRPNSPASGLGRTCKIPSLPPWTSSQRFWELLPDGHGLCKGGRRSLDLLLNAHDHAYTHAYIHAYTYAHTHVRTHTCTHVRTARSPTLPPPAGRHCPGCSPVRSSHLPAPMLPICSETVALWGPPELPGKGRGHQHSAVMATSRGFAVLRGSAGCWARALCQLCKCWARCTHL